MPVVVIGWYECGQDVFPTAKITKFQQSNLVYDTKGHALIPIAPSFTLSDGQEVGATRAVTLTAARPGGYRGKAILLDSVSLKVEHVPAKRAKVNMGIGRQNIVFPNRLNATLSPNAREAACQLLTDEGDPSGGVIVIDAEHPFAQLHIEMAGRAGLYRVGAVVTVSDETVGRGMRLESKEKVLVYVPPD